MGFNLGAFLGGAASGGSQVLDERRAQADRDKVTKEERQWQLATENRANARAKKSKRASDAKALEEQIGTMVALGMPADAARAVAKNGAGAMKVAIGDLQYGRENGVNAASYYTMGQKGLLQGDPSTAIKAAEPAGLVIDSEGIRSMYGAVDEDYTSHNEQIRAITNKQFNLTPEDPSYVKLEEQRQALYTDLAAIANAKDTADGEDSRKFTEGTVRATIGSEVNRQLQLSGMSYDLEKQIIVGLEGKRLEANIANLKAVNNLRTGTQSLNDPLMNDSITALEVDSKKNLRMKAATMLRENPELKTQPTVSTADYEKSDFESSLIVGQLIKIPDARSPTGDKLVMYMGVPGMEYLDVFNNE
jgi:hypothetical protein